MLAHGIVLAVIVLACGAAADLSEPKAAALTFVKAMADHDFATLRNASVGNDEERQRVEAMSDLMAAQRKFADAAAAKFGDSAPVQRGNVSAVFEEQLKTAEVKVEGDVASIRDPKDEKGPPLKLKKVGGEWKVDLSSMQIRSSALSSAGEQMKKLADVTNTTAEEVAADKYATFLEAQTALTQRMRSVIGSGTGSGTAPSSQPAK
jgi:hypothetical protein